MADKLRHRGKLTQQFARAFTEFSTERPDAALARVRVELYNKHDAMLARIPLAEALNAIAFDLPANGKASWADAVDVEIDDDGDDE